LHTRIITLLLRLPFLLRLDQQDTVSIFLVYQVFAAQNCEFLLFVYIIPTFSTFFFHWHGRAHVISKLSNPPHFNQ
jgi:hypothetical protein